LGTIQWTIAPYLGFVDLLALKRQSEKTRIKDFWDHLDFLSSFIKEIRISATGKQIIGFFESIFQQLIFSAHPAAAATARCWLSGLSQR
jgi:hypothetical protein